MKKITVDDGKAFDFGKTSKAYAKYRDIYPEEVLEKLHEIGVGVQGSRWLDLGTGTGVIPRGLAKYGADIVATDISEQQITEAIALSKDYSNIKYEVLAAEDISYPEHSFDAVTACQCFWYFDPNTVVPVIKSLLKPGGVFLKLYMSYLKEESIAQDSNSIVKRINGNWKGASPALQDLNTHYFEDPHTETMLVDIPFTRESWHGRMMASRGVMASMNAKQLVQFDAEHRKMLEEKYPERFTVRHKVFFTWYYM
jgi:ubiquinone/menaquinone biosynthesis C-methylase UbiE